MQLIDFALIGLAIAAPVAQAPPAEVKEATTCPDLQGAQVLSNNNQAYKLDCGKWVDAGAEAVLRIVTTEIGYKGCLTACDGTIDCGISQYIATDDAQTKGSCTLFKKDAPVKEGNSNSWTLATKIESEKKPATCPAPKPKEDPKPDPARPVNDDKFGLVTISTGSQINSKSVTAANGSITIGGKQDAACDKTSNFATFYIQDGGAYFYAQSATPQQLWVDRSGMGQGVSGYTTGAQPPPRNAEQKGFAVSDAGYLEFNGVGAVACPPGEQYKDAGWSIWFTTSEKPGFSEGCLPVELKAVKADEPVSCVYTASS